MEGKNRCNAVEEVSLEAEMTLELFRRFETNKLSSYQWKTPERNCVE